MTGSLRPTSLQASSLLDLSGVAVYKTAALPAVLCAVLFLRTELSCSGAQRGVQRATTGTLAVVISALIGPLLTNGTQRALRMWLVGVSRG
jgi:hypothetical protein